LGDNSLAFSFRVFLYMSAGLQDGFVGGYT